MANKSNVPAVPALGGEASLNRYLSEIRKFPLLTPERNICWRNAMRNIRILKRLRS
jgi:hypothetical protein